MRFHARISILVLMDYIILSHMLSSGEYFSEVQGIIVVSFLGDGFLKNKLLICHIC